MSDRELLELAAKAVGIDWFDEPALLAGKGLHMKSGPFWNPLIDDGDALRLAVKLSLLIDTAYNGCTAVGSASLCEILEPHNGDHCAATRRAIVRAAAAMARTTQQRKGNEK